MLDFSNNVPVDNEELKYYTTISNLITKYREEAKISKSELARTVKVDRRQIQKIEFGDQRCSLFLLNQIIHALKIKPNDIIGILFSFTETSIEHNNNLADILRLRHEHKWSYSRLSKKFKCSRARLYAICNSTQNVDVKT